MADNERSPLAGAVVFGALGAALMLAAAAGAIDRTGAFFGAGGSLLVETSEEQVPDALRLLLGGGLAARVATDDELGATVMVGTA